jgi:hypothetical protein
MCAGAAGGSLVRMNTTENSTPRELDARSCDGLDIRLLWNPGDDSVQVAVADARTGELFTIPVASQHALEAFHHPFAYAAPARDAMPVGG